MPCATPRQLIVRFALACIPLYTGCNGPNPPQTGHEQSHLLQDTITVSLEGLPKLALSEVLNNPRGRDVSQYSRIVVGNDGGVVFTSPMEALALTLRQRNGTATAFGRVGDGPGEVRDPLVLMADSGGILVADRANSRIVEFDPAGRAVRTQRTDAMIRPGGAPLGRTHWLTLGRAGQQELVRIVDLLDGSSVALQASADSFLSAHWPESRAVARNPPALGYSVDGLIVADRMTYEFVVLGLDGNRRGLGVHQGGLRNADPSDIARLENELARTGPRRRIAEAQETSVPWISQTIRQDHRGRTWMLAKDRDTAHVDVFQGTRFLARYTLPCRNPGPFWDLAGTWMAVICDPASEDADDDAIVQLYHLVESGPELPTQAGRN